MNRWNRLNCCCPIDRLTLKNLKTPKIQIRMNYLKKVALACRWNCSRADSE